MATMSITCGNCGQGVAATIVSVRKDLYEVRSHVEWLLCPACEDGSVMTANGAVYPVAAAGSTVRGVPDEVSQAWREARTTFAVAAYTASEMMCRKILMYVAVEKAGSKAREPFTKYIDDLVAAGYITAGAKPVIDLIRSRGGTATHRLPASSEEEAQVTLSITEHLLRDAYELQTFLPTPPTT